MLPSPMKDNVNLVVSEGDPVVEQKGAKYAYNYIGRTQGQPFTRMRKVLIMGVTVLGGEDVEIRVVKE